MRNLNSSIRLLALFLTVAIAGALGLRFWQSQKTVVPVDYGTPALWERLLDEPGALDVPSTTRAVVMPHHLIAATEMTKFYRGIARQFQPKTVFLVGPNHYEEGTQNIQTCESTYSTVRGALELNPQTIQILTNAKVASPNCNPFGKEHSLYAHATFIKQFLPDAKVVPILLKWKTSDEEIDRLVSFLDAMPNKADTLLIGSVDFSHYLPHLAADFHDQTSFAAIRNFDQDAIKNIEVDSPATLRLVTRWAELQGLGTVSQLSHTNSQDFFFQTTLERTTSHQFISFSQGPAEKSKQISLHFFGDAMFERGVETLMDSGDILSELASEEGRFFQGNDYNVLNLEGTLGAQSQAQDKEVVFQFDSEKAIPVLKKYGFNAVNLANNHTLDYFSEGEKETKGILDKAGILSFGTYAMGDKPCDTIEKNELKIALCGFNDVGGILPAEKAVAAIREAKKGHDLVFVNAHWGEEYVPEPTARQRDLAHRFITAGADLILGHHPHVVQPLEIYQGKPIFYSLGNFVFDQTEPKAVQTGLSVGVVATAGKLTFYVLPFDTNGGKPKPLDGEKRKQFLDDYLKELKIAKGTIQGKIEIDL